MDVLDVARQIDGDNRMISAAVNNTAGLVLIDADDYPVLPAIIKRLLCMRTR
jgi:hypothetical protein